MSHLGASMAGGNPKNGRRSNDHYPTVDTNVTEALLQRLRFQSRAIHECACGTGEMAEVIKAYGYDVIATDKIDYGYGEGGIDFLKLKQARAPVIVTNPPFELAQEFVEHALGQLGVEVVALFLKSTWFHARCRTDFFNRYRPIIKYDLTWRVDFSGQGRPTMECSWIVWKRGFRGFPVFKPLPKPTGSRLTRSS